MLTNTVRDAPLVPAMAAPSQASAEYFRQIVIALATGFQAWRSLVHERGLTDDEAAELMLGMVAAA